jgi:Sec-independent protein translocase protein TatA
MIGMPGATELIFICGIGFLFFGGAVMKRFIKGLGSSVKEARKLGKEWNDTVDELEPGDKKKR